MNKPTSGSRRSYPFEVLYRDAQGNTQVWHFKAENYDAQLRYTTAIQTAMNALGEVQSVPSPRSPNGKQEKISAPLAIKPDALYCKSCMCAVTKPHVASASELHRDYVVIVDCSSSVPPWVQFRAHQSFRWRGAAGKPRGR